MSTHFVLGFVTKETSGEIIHYAHIAEIIRNVADQMEANPKAFEKSLAIKSLKGSYIGEANFQYDPELTEIVDKINNLPEQRDQKKGGIRSHR